MNRFAIFGVLILTSTAAVAGDYEAASDKRLLCEAMEDTPYKNCMAPINSPADRRSPLLRR